MNYVSGEETSGIRKFRLLFILGSLIVLIGVVILVVAVMLSGGSVNFGGIVIVGPFPIIVGAGTDISWVVLLAIILAFLNFAIFLIMRREMKKSSG